MGSPAVELVCSDLLRIDTTNYGEGRAEGEREAAEYAAAALAAAGLDPIVLESARRRANVVAHVPGERRGDPLLIHGHLDVVPAAAEDWRIPPFSGEIHEGCVWGRGAVDMKGAVAMTLALVRRWADEGRRPKRDLILAFLADEESTGEYGAGFLVDHHRDHFAGCTEAISESGGFSVPAGDVRLYPIGVGERGTAWLRLTARGVAGHGSRPAVDNPVATLVDALSRLAAYHWPVRLTPGVRALLDGLSAALGTAIDLDRLDDEIVRLGAAGRLFASTVRNSANPTMLDAGYKVNVIPGSATAHVDGRFLPGFRDEFFETLDRILGPKVTREFVSFQDAPAADPDGPLFHAMSDAVRAEDHMGRPIPYVLGGGTDAKAFAQIGIEGYGFTPLLLGADLDFFGMFHGVDERVPVEALRFGVRVLDRFLTGPEGG